MTSSRDASRRRIWLSIYKGLARLTSLTPVQLFRLPSLKVLAHLTAIARPQANVRLPTLIVRNPPVGNRPVRAAQAPGLMRPAVAGFDGSQLPR